MKSRAHTLVTISCAALIAACLLWAWHARTAARGIENRQAKLAAQNAALKERLAALTAQTNPGVDDSSATKKTNAPTNPPAKYETALERFTRFDAENALRNKQLAKHTELQNKKIAANRVDVGIVYGPFFHMAGLTPDQTAKLTDALLQRDTAKDDTMAVRREHPDHQDDPVWKDLINEANDEVKTAAHSILGDEGFAQFQLYERQLPAWSYTENIAAGLALADMPVSFEQSQKLVEAMSNASAAFQDGKTMPQNLSDIDWSTVDTEAQKILTPEQFELFSTTMFVWGATARNVGSASRWYAEFQKALNNAMKPEAKK